MPSFGTTMTTELFSIFYIYSMPSWNVHSLQKWPILGAISQIGVIPGPAHQSFFWYDSHKDLKACFSVTRLKTIYHIKHWIGLFWTTQSKSFLGSLWLDIINMFNIYTASFKMIYSISDVTMVISTVPPGGPNVAPHLTFVAFFWGHLVAKLYENTTVLCRILEHLMSLPGRWRPVPPCGPNMADLIVKYRK